MSDAFRKEISAALADLEGHAPKPPRLDQITAGRARLTSTPDRRWAPSSLIRRWSPAAILVAAAAVTIVVVGVATFIASNINDAPASGAPTSTSVAPDAAQEFPIPPVLNGHWSVTSFTVGGVEYVVDPGAYAELNVAAPYVRFELTSLRGFTGCNEFGAHGADVEPSRLSYEEASITDGACPPGDTVSEAFDGAVRGLLFGEHGSMVTVLSASSLLWSGGDVVVRLAAGEPSVASGIESLFGIWLLDSYDVAGAVTTIDPAEFEAAGTRRPYLEFWDGQMLGFTGCNSVESVEPPELVDTILVLGDVISTMVDCDLDVEPRLLQALYAQDPVTVDVAGDTMTWTLRQTTYTFTRTDRLPVVGFPHWPTEDGRLTCSPEEVITLELRGDGLTTTQVMDHIPDVIAIEGETDGDSGAPIGYGLDAQGRVIATATATNPDGNYWYLSACATSFRIAPGASLEDGVATWIREMRLPMVDRAVWDQRLADLCSAPDDALAELAEAWVTEDRERTNILGGPGTSTVTKGEGVVEEMHADLCDPSD